MTDKSEITGYARARSKTVRHAMRLVALASVIGLVFGGPKPVQAQLLTSPLTQGQVNTPQQNGPLGSPYGSASGSASSQGTNQGGANAGQATASPFASGDTPQRTVLEGPAAVGGQTKPGASGDTLRTPMFSAFKPPPPRNEFSKFVEKTLGRPLPRFGEALQIDNQTWGALQGPAGEDVYTLPSTTTVPPDYLLNPGDEVVIHLTGSLEGEIRQTIDKDGRINLQRVGPVSLVGVRYGELQNVLTRKVGEQYRNFKLSVTVGQLKGVKVYVTGYAARPGAYTMNSLSTLVNAALAAGGPGAGGSFRSVQLRRGGQLISDFDLYDLLLKGDKSRDSILQNEDVLYIAPVGPEVAITGSINTEAIYEAKSGETLGDLIRYAGGTSSLADDTKAFVSRLTNLDTMGWEKIDLARTRAGAVQRGDIFKITSIADFARPLEKQSIVIKIEGEVAKPGRYYLPPNATMADVLAQAGGLTSRAFVFGSEIDRVSVQQQQQAGFDQAIHNLELAVAASPLALTGIDTGSQGTQSARAAVAQQVITQMKAHKPDGRIVLPLAADANGLPGGFVLENDDRIFIPPKPATVGVFGWVYQQGSFATGSARTVGDYLKLAGGPQRQAEARDIFVVRANGSVISKRQLGWGGRKFEQQAALPGDVIFVPVRTEQNLWWERAVQTSSILYNLGLGAAAIKVLTQ